MRYDAGRVGLSFICPPTCGKEIVLRATHGVTMIKHQDRQTGRQTAIAVLHTLIISIDRSVNHFSSSSYGNLRS